MMYNGREILRGVGFVKGKRITCPSNHRIEQRSRLLGDDLLYCDAQLGPGQPRCSQQSGFGVYVLVFPERGVGDRRRIFAADCSLAEIQEIERARLDPDGILEYFGATFGR